MTLSRSMVKRKVAIIGGSVLLAVAGVLLVIFPGSPEVYTGFPDVLSAAQRKEIPVVVRKETRRRVFALLKSGQFKAAWGELRSGSSQRIIAAAYEPTNTNKVWVYLGHSAPGTPSPLISVIYPMTNAQGHWKIIDR